MSTARATRRSGMSLVLLGLVGAFFFWFTDPRFGPVMHRVSESKIDWRYGLFLLRGSPDNLVDAANQAQISTIIGIAGAMGVLAVGFWLVTRKPV